MHTAADQTPSWGKDPLSPGDPEQPSRTTEAELAELEGQVAATTREVRRTESQVGGWPCDAHPAREMEHCWLHEKE